MPALRELRRAADLSQHECAALIDVLPVNTFRMWDSELRRVPPHVLQRVRVAVTEHARNAELVSLDLARELGVHQRTLRAAARTGRLAVTFSSRSAFGLPIRLATRALARPSCGRSIAATEDSVPP